MAVTATRLLDNYIDGEWTPAQAATDVLDVLNPANGEVLARVPLSGWADLDIAVRAAREALPEWRGVSTIARARKLFELRERLVARQEDLAVSVTTEMGKTIGDARAEVARMIEMVEAACAIPTTMQGRILEDVSRNIDAETIRQPVGVCAAIVPFNFPAMVPFWFLPFAIACGNTFVLKPSEQVPLTQQIAFEELHALGLPPGVVNLVNGGREVVESILDHRGIDAVSFVGSAPVARIVYERSAKAGKRVQALGGAKNHMVVMSRPLPRPSSGRTRASWCSPPPWSVASDPSSAPPSGPSTSRAASGSCPGGLAGAGVGRRRPARPDDRAGWAERCGLPGARRRAAVGGHPARAHRPEPAGRPSRGRAARPVPASSIRPSATSSQRWRSTRWPMTTTGTRSPKPSKPSSTWRPRRDLASSRGPTAARPDRAEGQGGHPAPKPLARRHHGGWPGLRLDDSVRPQHGDPDERHLVRDPVAQHP